MIVSKLAQGVIGSEIVKLAAEVNEKIKQGEKIYNLTVGDFNPTEFPIPDELKQYIINAYSANLTNYPPADGVLELREAVSNLLKQRQGINYKPEEILIAAGARPIIYSIFKALVDEGDSVIFAVPSWNNNHYTYLNFANAIVIEATLQNNFMPQAKDIKPHIDKASLVALCSPQNPTGTVFTKNGLEEICDLILDENKRRGPHQKPVYLMYDQIYWALTQGKVKHYDPVSLRPEMKNYTIFVDGISKSLAATGVRVGWGMGPKFIIDKMKAILTHVGAWAPKPEQIATANYLNDLSKYDAFLIEQKQKIDLRFQALYSGFKSLKDKGYKIDVIVPEAAIYLTVSFNLHNQKKADGKILETTKDITKYLLEEAKLALVPFSAFGAAENSSWYRLSVGTCKLQDASELFVMLEMALKKLS